MANSFTEGLSAGSAVIAPFVAAQQQANAAQLAQSQEAARMLFQSQALQQQLAARAALAQQDIDARIALDKARNIFTNERADEDFTNRIALAEQANTNAITQANEKLTAAEKLFNAQNVANTKNAEGVYNQWQETDRLIEQAVALTETDYEQAFAKAMQLTGVTVKKGKGEDFQAYYANVTSKNPNVVVAFQAALGEAKLLKEESPLVLSLAHKSQVLGNAFQRMTTAGNLSLPFLNPSSNLQADNVSANDLLAAAGNQPRLTGQPAVAVTPQGPVTAIPARKGAVQGLFQDVIPSAVGGGINILDNTLQGAGNVLFGRPAINSGDIQSTKEFIVNQGIATEGEVNQLDADTLSKFNLQRVRSEAATKASQLKQDKSIFVNPGGSGFPGF